MKEIKARDGYYLTQSADVADENRIFVTAIKGANINEEDWREATKAEKIGYEKESNSTYKNEDIIENSNYTESVEEI